MNRLNLEKKIQRKMMPRAKMIRNTEDCSGYDLHTIGYNRVVDGELLNPKNPTWFHDEFTSVNVYPGQRILLKTGVSIKLPNKRPHIVDLGNGYDELLGHYIMEAQIRPRSGMSLKTKTDVKLGTIDNPYIGDLGVIFENAGDEVYVVNDLDKIAQLVFQEVYIPIEDAGIVDVEELGETERGTDGFGSSGIKGGS